MPIYEYSCKKCGKTVEVIQKMSDKPLATHAGCGGRLTKLISAAGFQFKGTGWYVTDYANKGRSDGESAKESKDSKESKPESTPVAKESATATKEKAPDTASKDKPAKSSSTEKSKKS